jgi:hypothetical protein
LSLLVFRPPQPGSRAAAGRRVSDRVATLDAGEDGRTMGDEDDVTGWSWAISVVGGSVLCVGMVVCRRRPDLPWVRGRATRPVT